MNEYIILTRCSPNEEEKLLIKIEDLKSWVSDPEVVIQRCNLPHQSREPYRNPTHVAYGENRVFVTESPSEIESLIMSKPKLNIGPGPNQIHPDDYLLALFDIEKLKEENVKLKDRIDNPIYADLHSHIGPCIFSPIKAKRICSICVSKLEIPNEENASLKEKLDESNNQQ